MRRTCMTAVLFTFLTFCSMAFGADLPWEMKLPFKEATIHYELKGSQQGSETLYVKEYGKLRAKHHKASSTIMGRTTASDTLELIDPDWVTTYNLTQKTGEKFTNPNKLYLAEYSKFNSEEKMNFEKNAKEYGASMMGNFGGSVKQSSAKILGYDCDVATMGGMSTVYIMHGSGIPLRSEVAVMGMANTVNATQVDTSSAVPGSAFTPPVGITATVNQEMETMMAGNIQRTMQTLKRPDGVEAMKKSNPMLPAGVMPSSGDDENNPMDKEEQQQMMKNMQEAMKRMQQMKPRQ